LREKILARLGQPPAGGSIGTLTTKKSIRTQLTSKKSIAKESIKADISQTVDRDFYLAQPNQLGNSSSKQELAEDQENKAQNNSIDDVGVGKCPFCAE
jgi:hypothetical protein